MFTLPFYHSRFPLTRYGIATYGYGMLRNRQASSITFTADHRARLKRLSERTGTAISRVIGRLLDKYLADEERYADALDPPTTNGTRRSS